MNISTEDLEHIKDLLNWASIMSEKEDWDESEAQSLVMELGTLYHEIWSKKTNN